MNGGGVPRSAFSRSMYLLLTQFVVIGREINDKENVTELQKRQQYRRSQKCAMCYHKVREPFFIEKNMLNFMAKGTPNLPKL